MYLVCMCMCIYNIKGQKEGEEEEVEEDEDPLRLCVCSIYSIRLTHEHPTMPWFCSTTPWGERKMNTRSRLFYFIELFIIVLNETCIVLV